MKTRIGWPLRRPRASTLSILSCADGWKLPTGPKERRRVRKETKEGRGEREGEGEKDEGYRPNTASTRPNTGTTRPNTETTRPNTETTRPNTETARRFSRSTAASRKTIKYATWGRFAGMELSPQPSDDAEDPLVCSPPLPPQLQRPEKDQTGKDVRRYRASRKEKRKNDS